MKLTDKIKNTFSNKCTQRCLFHRRGWPQLSFYRCTSLLFVSNAGVIIVPWTVLDTVYYCYLSIGQFCYRLQHIIIYSFFFHSWRSVSLLCAPSHYMYYIDFRHLRSFSSRITFAPVCYCRRDSILVFIIT